MRDVRDPQLLERVAVAPEELRERVVDEREAPAAGDEPDPHRRPLEDRAEALVELDPRPLRRPDVGQVLADADQMARAAAGPVHGAADPQVAQLAVRAPEGHEAVEAAVLAHRSVDLALQPRAVLVDDHRQHVLARRHVVLRIDPEDAVRLGRPHHLLCLEVAVEGADLPEPLRLGQALLGAAVLGDVLAGAVEAADGAVLAHGGAAPAQQQPVAAVGVAHAELELHRPAALHRGP